MKKISNIFVSLLKLIGFAKSKKTTQNTDAIKMPQDYLNMVVEDFEMAAYHNQA